MSRQNQQRSALMVGIVVAIVSVLVFIALLLPKISAGLFDESVVVRADFRTITGLRQGSPVQLAGVAVGHVRSVDFMRVRYACDPQTEDHGRTGLGRTNVCDERMFCGPQSLCAELERWSSRGMHDRCRDNSECGSDEVCVTSAFQRRVGRVDWSGPQGVCARYTNEHWRTKVEMEIPPEHLTLVRNDSRAVVSSTSVLGSQLVNISVGSGEPLGDDNRVHTRTSLYEDIDRLRARVESFMEKADISLTSVSHFIEEISDERTIGSLNGIIDHLQVITRGLAYGEGLAGGMLNSRGYRADVGTTIRSIRNASGGLARAAGHANSILDTVDSNLDPLLADARGALTAVDQLIVDVRDPTNKSLAAKLVRDKEGRLITDLTGTVDNTADIITSLRNIVAAIERGDGTLGKLINDPGVGNDLTRLLHNLVTHRVIGALVKVVLQRRGYDTNAVSDPAAPRRR